MAKRKKIINYKAKTSLAVKNLILKDSDLIKKFPQENAITSNLFRRIRVKKSHMIEMEYNKHSMKASLVNALLDDSKRGNYHPEPDIISHYKEREWLNIVTVIEAKYFDKEGIKKDYYKIWAYRISHSIDQGQLIIYPKRGTDPPYDFVKSINIYNFKELEEELDNWKPNESGVINIVFNDKETGRIVKEKMTGFSVYKNENKKVLIVKNSKEEYFIYENNEIKWIKEEVEAKDNEKVEIIEYKNQKYKKTDQKEIINKSPTFKLREIIDENLFEDKIVKIEAKDFGSNGVIKYFVENQERAGKEIFDKRRNVFKIFYTLSHGFVFATREKLNLNNTNFEQVSNLGFGYEPGIKWTYFKVKDSILDYIEINKIIEKNKKFINSTDIEEIKKEIGL